MWGGRGERWEAKGRLKQPFGQKRQCCVQYVTYVHWHNPHCKLRLSYALIRSLTPHAVLLMPLRGHTGLKMHPHGLTMLGMETSVDVLPSENQALYEYCTHGK